MSSHNPEAALAAVESGCIDVLMFSVNPCYDLLPGDEDCEKLWEGESYAGVLSNMDRSASGCMRPASGWGSGSP